MENVKRTLINNIPIDRANLEYIMNTGKINGSLLASIESIMEKYKNYGKNNTDAIKLPVTFAMSDLTIKDADGLTILKVMDNFGIYKGNFDKVESVACEIIKRINNF